MAENQFKKHYNSFSGCDIRATFGAEVIGQLQGISWSVTREKAPIYTMGSPDPRAFSRGKRGIAGSLIFIQFDAHALLSSQVGGEHFSDDKNNIGVISNTGELVNASNRENAIDNTPFTNPTGDQENISPYYSDQILPFDVVLSAANEYGQGASMKIFGVEILNEGAGVSIDDIVLEQQMTFIARGCTGWQSYSPK
jgi:hypothetical protein